MLKIFSKKHHQAKLTDEELALKAAGVIFAVFTISDEITKTLQKKIKGLGKLKDEEVYDVFFIVFYVMLFQAQKFFWENIIRDEVEYLYTNAVSIGSNCSNQGVVEWPCGPLSIYSLSVRFTGDLKDIEIANNVVASLKFL